MADVLTDTRWSPRLGWVGTWVVSISGIKADGLMEEWILGGCSRTGRIIIIFRDGQRKFASQADASFFRVILSGRAIAGFHPSTDSSQHGHGMSA